MSAAHQQRVNAYFQTVSGYWKEVYEREDIYGAAEGASMMTQALDSYLAVRRAAGFKLKKVEYYLRRFVEFSSNKGQAYISAQTSIEWARQGTSPGLAELPAKNGCVLRPFSVG